MQYWVKQHLGFMQWVQQIVTDRRQAALKEACREKLLHDMRQECAPHFEHAFSELCEDIPKFEHHYSACVAVCEFLRGSGVNLVKWLDTQKAPKNIGDFNESLNQFLGDNSCSHDMIMGKVRDQIFHVVKLKCLARELYNQHLAKVTDASSYNRRKESTFKKEISAEFGKTSPNLIGQALNRFTRSIAGAAREFDTKEWYRELMDDWVRKHSLVIARYLEEEKMDESTARIVSQSLQYIVGEAFGVPSTDGPQIWLKDSVNQLKAQFGEEKFRRFEQVIVETLYKENKLLVSQSGIARA